MLSQKGEILKVVGKKPMSVKEISKKSKIAYHSIQRRIADLVNDGIITSEKCKCCGVGVRYRIVS